MRKRRCPYEYVRSYNKDYALDGWPKITPLMDINFLNLFMLLPNRSQAGIDTYNLYVPTTEELLEWYSP